VLTVNAVTVQNKVYDGTTIAPLHGSFSGRVGVDMVTLTGAFDNKNVGTDKAITLGFTGLDSGNYTLASVSPAPVADITRATLTYVADPATRLTGAPITGLSGSVTGFVAGDSQQTSTQGTLVWTTPATAASPAGIYAINGSGLTATNYDFQQAASNATALTLLRGIDPVDPREKQNTVDTSVFLLNTAMYGSFPVLDFVTTGFVNDLAALRVPRFGPLDLSRMSWADMRQLIEERREFKEKLFADAIYKLEQDPSLANVPACPSLADIRTGLCRITDAQRMALASKVTEEDLHKRQPKTKVARLPQIERKVAVLFGVDQYANKSIPSLENAIADAEAVGKLFTGKLGYEVRVVKNPTKADIVRTLNQLSTEMQGRDSVIIYYAGHGYRNEKTGGGYWIPSDASPSDPTSWISNTDVSSMMSDISAKQMVMIADSCYSGTFAEQKLGVSGIGAGVKPDEVLAKRSVIVMSSGGDEPVADEGKDSHSIFAWDLMQALRNVDNWQPGTTIFEQVKRDVMKSFPQTPQYGGVKSAGHEAGGEYLFEFRQLEDVQ
ncbi:MAG TPA: caspase family protein, partial [Nitrosospira sp.]|nr:caspase family protein [Nitrosospira sp.]